MTEWFKNIKFAAILWSTLSYTIIAMVIHQIEAIFTVGYYQIPEYFGVWNKLMMSDQGGPKPIFVIISTLFALITGFILATTYFFLKDHLSQGYWTKVLSFTLLLSVISVVTFTLPAILLFNVPILMMFYWLLSGVFIFFFGSMVFAKIIG
jgi:hypothetical protein